MCFPKNSIVTIGTFDGVHIGHQKILKKLIELGKAQNLKSVVLTFFPHPRMVLQKDAHIKLLNTIDERRKLILGHGVEHIEIMTFSKEFSRLTATEFVRDILVNKLRAKTLVVGYDHHFGRNRSANIQDLKEFGAHYGFEVVEILKQDVDDVAVSSTKIRNALAQGDIRTANLYLGNNFMITGKVETGNGLGRTLGFPTANLSIKEPYKLIPKDGVYVVCSKWDNQSCYGMMNIGFKPTVASKAQTIEVHLLGIDRNLYGKTLEVHLLHRLRDEQKFKSIKALKEQLQIDRINTLGYLAENCP